MFDMNGNSKIQAGLDFFNSPVPRDRALGEALAAKASLTSRIAYYISLGLVGIIALIILLNAGSASEMVGGVISTAFIWLIYAGPLYVYRRRARSRLEKVALEGSRIESRVVNSSTLTYAGGTINRVTMDFTDSQDRAWQVGVDIPCTEPVHAPGDTVSVLHHGDVTSLVLVASEQMEPQVARLLTAEKATTKSRVIRIVIGVVVGVLLMVLLFWATAGR